MMRRLACSLSEQGTRKKEGTRELVLSPLPYIVVYRVIDDVVFIVRILQRCAEAAIASPGSDRGATL